MIIKEELNEYLKARSTYFKSLCYTEVSKSKAAKINKLAKDLCNWILSSCNDDEEQGRIDRYTIDNNIFEFYVNSVYNTGINNRFNKNMYESMKKIIKTDNDMLYLLHCIRSCEYANYPCVIGNLIDVSFVKRYETTDEPIDEKYWYFKFRIVF